MNLFYMLERGDTNAASLPAGLPDLSPSTCPWALPHQVGQGRAPRARPGPAAAAPAADDDSLVERARTAV